MIRVYACESSRKKELMKILEAEPYAEDSFARVGYRIKDGSAIGEDPKETYIYINASEDFVKKADAKLRGVAGKLAPENEKRIAEKIEKEEEEAQSGFGSIFGE